MSRVIDSAALRSIRFSASTLTPSALRNGTAIPIALELKLNVTGTSANSILPESPSKRTVTSTG
jgi:hypothetical protein